MTFYKFTRKHSSLLPAYTYSVDTTVTNRTLGSVARMSNSRGWLAHKHGASRPMPAKYATRRDAAEALWHTEGL